MNNYLIFNAYSGETVQIQVVAYLCIFLSAVRIIPQLFKIIHTRSFNDVSIITQVITFVATGIWTIYGILVNDITVYLSSFIQFACALAIFFLILIFKNKENNENKLNKRIELEQRYLQLKLREKNKGK